MSGDINPYQPSANPARPARTNPAALDSGGPHYQARLDWPDRQALLRAIAPQRLGIAISVVIVFKRLFEHIVVWGSALWRNEHGMGDAIGLAAAALAFVYLCSLILELYPCRLAWLYADRLQDLAGGQTASASEWSQLSYRLSWWSAAAAILYLGLEAGYWVLERWSTASNLGL